MRTLSISKKSAVCGLWSTVPRRRSTTTGFTLLELLVVISLIMVLAGFLIPAFYQVRKSGRDTKRSVELRVIESAIGFYKTQEKKFPAPPGDLDGGEDLSYGEDGYGDPLDGGDNYLVMDELTNAVPPVLDPNKLRWDADGNVIDPYAKQYKIWLDLDYSEFGAGYKVE